MTDTLDLEELKRLMANAVCKPPWHGFTEPRDPSNRALAIAAVNSLPALIAEVERLRAENEILEARVCCLEYPDRRDDP